MIPKPTLKRAAVAGGITIGLLAVPTVYTWWAECPAERTEKKAPVTKRPASGATSIQAAPSTTEAPAKKLPRGYDLVRTLRPLKRSDYTEYRGPAPERPTEEEAAQP